ncbi:Protein of unknown function [Bacillus cytotoxicus]|uniref:Uncharacterized protein n=1 Tax=Bacillus cytotoxicus TaxID=580165 RepID=A0AAX2CBZ2_9BACI|nr:Protein of unknown function [Bacillus cytotoxicus]SCN29460.1 Protein of unknown function [Bacillus cytotoxicus]
MKILKQKLINGGDEIYLKNDITCERSVQIKQ